MEEGESCKYWAACSTVRDGDVLPEVRAGPSQQNSLRINAAAYPHRFAEAANVRAFLYGAERFVPRAAVGVITFDGHVINSGLGNGLARLRSRATQHQGHAQADRCQQ